MPPGQKVMRQQFFENAKLRTQSFLRVQNKFDDKKKYFPRFSFFENEESFFLTKFDYFKIK